MDLLHTAHVPAGEGPFPTLVTLHGWGASAHDLLSLAPFLHRGDALVLCPQGSIEVPVAPDYAEFSYQSYIVGLREGDLMMRDRLMNELLRRGVGTRRGLMAIHREPCYADARTSGTMQHTERAADTTFLLPIYPDLLDDDAHYVTVQLRESIRSVIAPSKAKQRNQGR